MRPFATKVAWLCGYQLVFDLAIGSGERGVGNLLPLETAKVCGVTYQIASEQADTLDRTEGVPRAYQRIDVALEVGDEQTLQAFTYLSENRRTPGRKASPRYMGLLLHGARHHGLSQDYVDELRGIELAIDERDSQLELFPRGRDSRGGPLLCQRPSQAYGVPSASTASFRSRR